MKGKRNLGKKEKKKKILTHFIGITVALTMYVKYLDSQIILADECSLVRISNDVGHNNSELEVKDKNKGKISLSIETSKKKKKLYKYKNKINKKKSF